ncbi:hypothetical protein DLP3_004 [Stenotrophomonas phage vB_SmaS_DLP_3]|nr:hypothetical protein DLP3_004 [Stenotrophomonas phage vB_SmaS_DLP_3]
MSDPTKVEKANPYRGAGGKFCSQRQAVSTMLTVPKQPAIRKKPQRKSVGPLGGLKF